MKKELIRLSSVVLVVIGLVLFTNPVRGDDPITKVILPVEVTSELHGSAVPKEIEGLQWNRWTTKNFVVCSLDDQQAQYLHKHLELVKGWAFIRWGLTDIDFASECKLICVNKPDLFKKLFNLDSTRAEVRRDENGKIKETVIFLLLDDLPSKTVPMPITEVCLAEFSQRYNTKFGSWVYRGMSSLNGSIPQIRAAILDIRPVLDKDDPIYFSKGLLEMDMDKYSKLTIEQKKLYDKCAMTLCLLIRKEFGQDKYLDLLKRSSEIGADKAVNEVLGFENCDQFDKTLKRYMIDLTNDLTSGKTPDHYLQIREK